MKEWANPREIGYFNKVSKLLEETHRACYAHKDRDILGMTNGPFSGVNNALSLVHAMEIEIFVCHEIIHKLKKSLDEKDKLQ